LTQIRTEQGAWTAQSPKYNSAGAEPQPNTALVLNLRGNDADKKSTDNNGPVLHNKENKLFSTMPFFVYIGIAHGDHGYGGDNHDNHEYIGYCSGQTNDQEGHTYSRRGRKRKLCQNKSFFKKHPED